MYSIFYVRFDSRCYTFLAFILSSIFTSTVYAGAAEKWDDSPRHMSIADIGMRTRNGIGVENVRAANGMINADITQRVTVDGSNATINTKVSIPANDDTFARRSASHAKNLLRGGAWAAGAAVAMDQILDAVDWVMDPENNTVKKKGVATNENYSNGTLSGNAYCLSVAQGGGYQAGSISNCRLTTAPNHKNGSPCVKAVFYWSGQVRETTQCSPVIVYTPPNLVTVPDGEIEDAFYNWMKNNPKSITDPVTTYIYSPKDSQGNALPKSPEGSDPSFGPNEITDEMMNNYMEHRNANLQNPYTTTIGDSTQTDTTQNPDGSKTSTKTNPDGSKTTTRTDTKTDPDTGEVTTTVTETTTNPDGSTSTKTETSTQTKPKPETTDLPAFCDYAATLCTWIKKDIDHKADEKSLWDKIKEFFDDTPEKDNDTEIEIEELPKPTEQVKLPTSNSECPSLIYNFDLRTFKAQADFSPVWLCEIAEGLYYFFVGLGWYLSACILGWRSS